MLSNLDLHRIGRFPVTYVGKRAMKHGKAGVSSVSSILC